MYTGSRRQRAAFLIATIASCPVSFADTLFNQTNLTSDIPGLAANTDPNLKNPWGVSFSPTSPFWVSDQMTNVSTLYNASGAPQSLVVSTPGGPTGQVFNPTTGFALNGKPATFIFSTLSGNIEAWNGGNAASVVQTVAGAVYTGLTMGTMGTANVLFAANKATGKIDVFDSSFQPITLGPGAFRDPNVPAGMTPYNIQIVNGNLYVEYSGTRGAPGGFVAEFDTSGNLIRDIADAHLNAPWGITMAPIGFGDFGGDLLIGNFNDGMINAFNPLTGGFVGTLLESNGTPFAEPGLWALEFRNTSSPNANTGSNPDALFFVAGINGERDGLFGVLTAVPEPASFELLGLAVLAAAVVARRRSSVTRL